MSELLKPMFLDSDSHDPTVIAFINGDNRIIRSIEIEKRIEIIHDEPRRYEDSDGSDLFVTRVLGTLIHPRVLADASIMFFCDHTPDIVHSERRVYFQFVLYSGDSVTIAEN